MVYIKNKYTCFVGLVNNINFNSEFKKYGDDYYDQIGTFNYERDRGAALYKNTFIDRTWSIQYVLGFDIKMSKGNTIGVEFVDYFGYRYYYSKYFGNSYDTQRISSSSINFYVAFDLDRE